MVILNGQRNPLADILAKPRINRPRVAAAHHEIHAAFGKVLEVGVILGDAHGVGGGNQRCRGRQNQIFGLRCEVR